MSEYRIEKDFLGEKQIPSKAYYGIFTARALENFQISSNRIHPLFIKNLALIKKAAAMANLNLGFLSEEHSNAIIKAAELIIEGKYYQNFPLDVFQAGAGTPWNMNMNEVLANLANELLGKPLGSYSPIHPNNQVNMMQSSNDVIPNTIRLTILTLLEDFLKDVNQLIASIEFQSKKYEKIKKSGRTHLRDATPITFGLEMRAYATALRNSKLLIENSTKYLQKIHLGGTAVGTGVNTHPDFPRTILKLLKDYTGFKLSIAEDFVEKTQFLLDFQNVMDALSNLCLVLIKINNDLMFLSSGPMTGLNEINLPAVEPGSSIMPGKINPSILESVNMVCFQILGNRMAVEHATRSGLFEINVYTPLIANNIFNSFNLLTNALKVLREKTIDGLKVNVEVMEKYFRHSNALATILVPLMGYEEASKFAKLAAEENKPVDALVVSQGILSRDEMNQLSDHSTEPNLDIIKSILKEKSKQ